MQAKCLGLARAVSSFPRCSIRPCYDVDTNQAWHRLGNNTRFHRKSVENALRGRTGKVSAQVTNVLVACRVSVLVGSVFIRPD